MARTSFKLNKSSNPALSKADIAKLIEKKAYELYEKRGKKPGDPAADWIEAERIVLGQYKQG